MKSKLLSQNYIELDGLLKEIYDTCDDDDWFELLVENSYTNYLIFKWDRWIMKWIAGEFCPKLPFTNTEINYLNSKLIDDYVKMGQPRQYTIIHTTNICTKEFPISVGDGRYKSYKTWSDMFTNACNHGYVHMAKFLCLIKPLKVVNDTRTLWTDYINSFLTDIRSSKSFGKCPISEYHMNEGFGYACMYSGNIELAKWIYEKYPTQITLKSDSYVFQGTCRTGYIHIAKWLLEICPEINYNLAVETVIYDGQLEVLKWLATLPLFTLCIDKAKTTAEKKGHDNIVEWLSTYRGKVCI